MKIRPALWLLAALVVYAANVAAVAWWLPPEPVSRLMLPSHQSLSAVFDEGRQAIVFDSKSRIFYLMDLANGSWRSLGQDQIRAVTPFLFEDNRSLLVSNQDGLFQVFSLADAAPEKVLRFPKRDTTPTTTILSLQRPNRPALLEVSRPKNHPNLQLLVRDLPTDEALIEHTLPSNCFFSKLLVSAKLRRVALLGFAGQPHLWLWDGRTGKSITSTPLADLLFDRAALPGTEDLPMLHFLDDESKLAVTYVTQEGLSCLVLDIANGEVCRRGSMPGSFDGYASRVLGGPYWIRYGVQGFVLQSAADPAVTRLIPPCLNSEANPARMQVSGMTLDELEVHEWSVRPHTEFEKWVNRIWPGGRQFFPSSHRRVRCYWSFSDRPSLDLPYELSIRESVVAWDKTLILGDRNQGFTIYSRQSSRNWSLAAMLALGCTILMFVPVLYFTRRRSSAPSTQPSGPTSVSPTTAIAAAVPAGSPPDAAAPPKGSAGSGPP